MAAPTITPPAKGRMNLATCETLGSFNCGHAYFPFFTEVSGCDSVYAWLVRRGLERYQRSAPWSVNHRKETRNQESLLSKDLLLYSQTLALGPADP